MSGGRPTDYRPEYCQVIIEEMGGKGKSIAQFARDLQVSRKTIYNWADANPEFLHALTLAMEFSEAYWEDKFPEFMVDNKVNAPLVKLYYANRFKWTDKAVEPSDPPPSKPIEFTDANPDH